MNVGDLLFCCRFPSFLKHKMSFFVFVGHTFKKKEKKKVKELQNLKSHWSKELGG